MLVSPVCLSVCLFVCHTYSTSNISSQNFQARTSLTQHTICIPYKPSEPNLTLPYPTAYILFYTHTFITISIPISYKYFFTFTFHSHTLINVSIISYHMLTYLTLLLYPTLNFILYPYLYYHIPYLLQMSRLLSIKPNGRYD